MEEIKKLWYCIHRKSISTAGKHPRREEGCEKPAKNLGKNEEKWIERQVVNIHKY